ncbi:MAG TPA: ABC transporter permease, partial [Thermoanaerobaculia bacterium]
MSVFYRALLHLYPASFRAEYGAEMRADFAERKRESPPPLAGLGLALRAILDVVPNALGAHWDILRQDLRYAVRALGRAPGFTATAIVVVALGVGANTAAFSLADLVLLRPLPFPQPDRLVKLWQTTPGFERLEVSPANYRDWKAIAGPSFAEMGAYTDNAVNLVGQGAPRRLTRALVTPEVLRVVGTPPLLGRTFAPADGAASTTAVLSYALWRSQFGGDPDVVGRTVRLDGVPHTVIGVMPEGFHFPSREIEIWTPLVVPPDEYTDRNNDYFEVVARLAPGVPFEKARTDLATVAARLQKQYPTENKDVGAALLHLRDELPSRSRLLVLALSGAALCILVLACANLASLLLTRAAGRSRELAVRSALGAGRERLVRQLITESLALAVLGGIAGVAVAAGSLPLLARLVPAGLPIGQVPTIDLRVLAFAAALIAATGLGFGIAPALRAGSGGGLLALRDGGRTGGGRRQRLSSALVVLEVASSVVLLVASGLLLRAAWRIQAVDPGFRAEA